LMCGSVIITHRRFKDIYIYIHIKTNNVQKKKKKRVRKVRANLHDFKLRL
jgi:hypothetical protein